MEISKTIVGFFLFMVSGYVMAQADNELPARQLSVMELSQGDSVGIPDEFNYALDHMLSNWLLTKIKKTDCDTTLEVPLVSDSIINLRLRRMPYVMEMPFNPYVRSFIDLYTVRRRTQLSYLLGLSDYYFKIFEHALEKAKLPLELKYLPVIESALRPTAYSRAGAAGLWQFMVGTGKMYGLEINSLIDERMDPYKSTNAAVQYLKDLYAIYEDWHLVIAAYNCGPGNVNKAIRRAGGKQDYWTIYPYLPAETRGYVPIFIAANYAMHYANAHNVCKTPIEFPKVADTIVVRQRLHLEQIASVMELPIEQLRIMNPQYRRDIIPGDMRPYSVTLPMNTTGKFIDKLTDIATYKADSLINNRRTEIAIKTPAAGSQNVIYHRVRSGQTLGGIAARYGVSVAKLRSWNNIRGSMIRAGQRLKIYK
ncbi:MAG: transglycosylase SLT domain-containing protein [Paludibacter sp.]|jgi:membrane-bound lytic murein transglycosylase D|nr:transglycosylase SLT domain-containing protein [Paludibacter sp.]